MANAVLSKIIKDVNVPAFQAEYQPVLDSDGNPADRPLNCDIPIFINPVLGFPATPIPPIDKTCSIPFIAIPVVPTPYIDIIIPGITCPSGISFTGGIDVKVGDTTTHNDITIAPVGEDGCTYDMSGLIDLDVTIPCPDGSFVTTTGISVTIHDSNYTSGDNNDGVPQAFISTSKPNACTTDLSGSLEIFIPTLPVLACPDGITIDTSEFYVTVDNPNGCGETRHQFGVGRGGDSTPAPIAVAVGTNNSMIWSEDNPNASIKIGDTWTTGMTGDANYDWRGVTNSKNWFVAVGKHTSVNKASYSNSALGKSWSTNDITGLNAYFYSVTNGCNIFVAVGESGVVGVADDDKDNAPTFSTSAPYSGTMYSVAFGCTNRFVAVGASGKIVLSTDKAVTWNTVHTGGSALRSVIASGGKFVAVGDGGTILVSSDCGKTWTSHNSGSSDFAAVSFADGKYVAITTGGATKVSKDAFTWTADVSTSGAPRGMDNDGKFSFIVVGDSSLTKRLDIDIDTWATGTNSVTSDLKAVSFRSGSNAGAESCQYSFFPPLKIELPYIPCPDGETLTVGSISVTNTVDSVTSVVGAGNLSFSPSGAGCAHQLVGTIDLTGLGSSGDSGICGAPRWG